MMNILPGNKHISEDRAEPQSILFLFMIAVRKMNHSVHHFTILSAPFQGGPCSLAPGLLLSQLLPGPAGGPFLVNIIAPLYQFVKKNSKNIFTKFPGRFLSNLLPALCGPRSPQGSLYRGKVLAPPSLGRSLWRKRRGPCGPPSLHQPKLAGDKFKHLHLCFQIVTVHQALLHHRGKGKQPVSTDNFQGLFVTCKHCMRSFQAGGLAARWI